MDRVEVPDPSIHEHWGPIRKFRQGFPVLIVTAPGIGARGERNKVVQNSPLTVTLITSRSIGATLLMVGQPLNFA
jgi:hypothetical protein